MMQKHDTHTNGDTANKSATGDGSVNNGDVVGKFLLEHTVKVLTASDCHQSIGIC